MSERLLNEVNELEMETVEKMSEIVRKRCDEEDCPYSEVDVEMVKHIFLEYENGMIYLLDSTDALKCVVEIVQGGING